MADATTSLASLAEPSLQFLRSVQMMVRLAKEPTIGSRPADFLEAAKMAHNDFKFLQLLASKVGPTFFNVAETVRTIHANLVALVKHLREVIDTGAALDQVPPHVGEAIWLIAESVKQIVAAAQQELSGRGSENAIYNGAALGSASQPSPPFSPTAVNSYPNILPLPEQSNSSLPSPRSALPNGSGPQQTPNTHSAPLPMQTLELDLVKVQSGVRSLGSLTDIFFGEDRGQSRSHVAPAAAELTKHSFELQVAAKAFGMQEYAVKLMERTTDVLFCVKQAVATREHPEAMLALDESVKILAALFKEFVRSCALKGVALITSAQPAPAPASAPSPRTQTAPATNEVRSYPVTMNTGYPPAAFMPPQPSTSPTGSIGGEQATQTIPNGIQTSDNQQAGAFVPDASGSDSRPVSGEHLSSEGDDSDAEGALEDIMDTLEDAFADLSVEESATGESPRETSSDPAAPSASVATGPPAVPNKPVNLGTPTTTITEQAPVAASGGEAPPSPARRKRYPVPPKRVKKTVVVEDVMLGGPSTAVGTRPRTETGSSTAATPTTAPPPRKSTKTTKALKQFLSEAATRPTAGSFAMSGLPSGSLPPPKSPSDILSLWETLEHLISTADFERMQSRARWDLHNQRKEERANREVSLDSSSDDISSSKSKSGFSLFKRIIGSGSSDSRGHSGSTVSSPRGSPKAATATQAYPARNPQGREIPLPPRQGGQLQSPQSQQQASSATLVPPSQDPSRVLNWSASRGSIRRPLLSSVGLEDVSDPRVEKFEAPDTDDVIRFSDDGSRVIGGTIEKLIQRLTYDGFPDPQFVQSFMMTYRTFITPRELMTLMELRWNSRPPADKDLEQFCKERMLPIRLRVFNFLKTWIEKSFSDIQGDDVLIESMREFVKRLERAGMIQPASQLLNALERRLEGASGIVGTAFPGQQPPPPFPHSGLRFRDFHPIEVARQLTIAENALFRNVQPYELLDVSWTKKDKETKSPNVLAMIRFSNHVISWISSEIVSPEDIRERGVILNRFIAVAQAALSLNNYNAAMEVVSALHNASVYRLQQTWNMLPDETWTAVEALERLFESDDNFKNYRVALERSVPPCVPYLGRYLSDLLFIEEKHQRMLDDNLINFGKLDTIASTIGSLELQQKSPYALQEVPEIINYIKNYSIMNERDLYNISLQREARKAK